MYSPCRKTRDRPEVSAGSGEVEFSIVVQIVATRALGRAAMRGAAVPGSVNRACQALCVCTNFVCSAFAIINW